MPSNTATSALFFGAFSIAAMHALIPSHWLAFAIVGRAHRWTSRRTLTVAALAGGGHILMTVLLGWIVAVVGKELNRAIPPQLEHAATAGLLIALGLYFLWPALCGKSGSCGHIHGEAAHQDQASGSFMRRIAGTPTVMGALVLGMTLSPCLDLLSVYVAASALSWQALIAISAIMATTTLVMMLGLIWLTHHGLQRLNLAWLDRNERTVIGSILILLGILLFII
jgi:nickel/cobalt exporter